MQSIDFMQIAIFKGFEKRREVHNPLVTAILIQKKAYMKSYITNLLKNVNFLPKNATQKCTKPFS